MFKFDNAFLTSKNKVGIQFVDRNIKGKDGKFRTATVYEDEKGVLKGDCTIETLNMQEYKHLVHEYNKRKQWFMPRKRA